MNLYLRLLWTLLRAWRRPEIALGDTIEVPMRVWLNDLDVNGHMNNGRYMTLTDLAVIEYFVRAGFFGVMWRNGWRPMLGGATIAFRRGLRLGRAYRLRLTMCGWDSRWSYLQFEFVQAGNVVARGLAKGAIVGRQGIVPTAELHAALGLAEALQAPAAGATVPVPPALAPVLAAWAELDRRLQPGRPARA